jgi:luciferase family oxidoreductase group 1
LGLGRAPGTDQRTLLSLRRDPSSSERFPQDVLELQELLGPFIPGQAVRAVPGSGTKVPIWILGSSLFGARLAAALGLPYAFASHFAPGSLTEALELYRAEFRPSEQQKRPLVMLGVNVVIGETDEAARKLFTSLQQSFANIHRGARGKLPPPIEDIADYWSPFEKLQAGSMLSCSFAGSRETVQAGLENFLEKTGADELMVSSPIYDHSARLRSYEILAEVQRDLKRSSGVKT